ncbi:MAG: EAL domain-containing protein [Spirochaetia bacterium]
MEDTFERIINLSPDYVALIRPDHTYELANQSFATFVGVDKSKVTGKPLRELLSESLVSSELESSVDRCVAGETLRYMHAARDGGDHRLLEMELIPFQEQGGAISHALLFARDVTDAAELQRRQSEAEYRDPLTGLLTRRSLAMILEKDIENAHRAGSNQARALLFISLKNFKRINQTHGTRVGDLLLENTGIRITQQLRKSDYLFRFEGTNLVAFLPNVNHSTDPAVVAQKLSDAVGVPYRFRGMDLRVSAVIGISVFPEDAEDAETLLQHANSAVIEAEASDRTFQLYDTSLHERALARMTLHTELLRAFESQQLELYYQPIVDLHGRIHGAEALIRWHHPNRGLITPKHFMRLAEETGIVTAIDKWALYGVCNRIAEWCKDHEIFVSMNISARELDDDELSEIITAAMSSAGGIPPGRLKLELTESGCMSDPQKSIQRIRSLKNLGVDIWIDDFGTGQSSLSYLKRLPVSVLKIDKVFVDDLADSSEDRAYLESIMAGVRSRGKQVIIEGVSSKEQHEILARMGARWLQGYYFAKPLPAHEFAKLLEAG